MHPNSHHHPRNPLNILWGIRLKKGDVPQEGDYYAASNGRWEPVTCAGLPIEDDDGYWVRMCPVLARPIC